MCFLVNHLIERKINMASMVLKDMLICPECGEIMFPSAFDKKSRTLQYCCCAQECKTKSTKNFDEVAVPEYEKINFFVLNDDGEVTWKCHFHGYCECLIEDILDKDFTKFEHCCCIWGREDDEIFGDEKYAHEDGKIIIRKILSALDEEMICILAEEIGIELEEYNGKYADAFVDAADFLTGDFRDYVYSLTDQIYSLFDISLDENGEMLD